MSADEKIMSAGFDHPCRQTCSGWKQGRMRGHHDFFEFLEAFPENDAITYFWSADMFKFDPKADRHSFEQGAKWMFNRMLKHYAELQK